MTVFPQLITGSLSQYPMTKVIRSRTVVNAMADGSVVKFSAPTAGGVEWHLEYQNLTDEELGNLQQFFTSTQGSLNSFTFLDPTANLLAWSEQLSNSVWQPDPLLHLTSGVVDPFGGTNGWHLANAGAGPQKLTQTLNAPGGYVYAFSVYIKAMAPTTITLLSGDQRADRAAAVGWTRFAVTAAGDATAQQVAFGVEVPASAEIDLFGPQVEVQLAPSMYKPSTSGGVFEGARFLEDTLTQTTTDMNRHSATVRIFYANHL